MYRHAISSDLQKGSGRFSDPTSGLNQDTLSFTQLEVDKECEGNAIKIKPHNTVVA